MRYVVVFVLAAVAAVAADVVVIVAVDVVVVVVVVVDGLKTQINQILKSSCFSLPGTDAINFSVL